MEQSSESTLPPLHKEGMFSATYTCVGMDIWSKLKYCLALFTTVVW